jgi:hypothetical protein
MTDRITTFKLWMRAATTEEQKLLAHRVGTSRAYLFHISGGFREPRPELAIAIERETAQMHKVSKGRLPLIYRTDLVKACAQCSFAQKCLGAAAVRADFPIVTNESLAEEDDHGN